MKQTVNCLYCHSTTVDIPAPDDIVHSSVHSTWGSRGLGRRVVVLWLTVRTQTPEVSMSQCPWRRYSTPKFQLKAKLSVCVCVWVLLLASMLDFMVVSATRLWMCVWMGQCCQALWGVSRVESLFPIYSAFIVISLKINDITDSLRPLKSCCSKIKNYKRLHLPFFAHQ